MSSSVRTYVTFKSEAFNISKRQDQDINPECFGDDLCRWMIAKLIKVGVRCDTEPGQEDYGWYFNFWMGDAKYCFVCGYRPPDESGSGVWIGWIERSTNFVSSLFGARDRGIESLSAIRINGALSNSPEISDIKWHFKGDFDKGNEDAGKDSPD